MPCATPCKDYLHRDGRCLCVTNASRAAIGLAPLPEPDEPLETVESAEAKFVTAATAVAVSLLLLAILAVEAYGPALVKYFH